MHVQVDRNGHSKIEWSYISPCGVARTRNRTDDGSLTGVRNHGLRWLNETQRGIGLTPHQRATQNFPRLHARAGGWPWEMRLWARPAPHFGAIAGSLSITARCVAVFWAFQTTRCAIAVRDCGRHEQRSLACLCDTCLCETENLNNWLISLLQLQAEPSRAETMSWKAQWVVPGRLNQQLAIVASALKLSCKQSQ